ncbi:DNA gyrase subunit A, chloroplastic/mitochondrial [Tanacetum coccineum]
MSKTFISYIKTLDGISDIRNESDRSGMRIVIELKRGSDPSIVLNNFIASLLYSQVLAAIWLGVYPDYTREPSDLALRRPNVKNVTLMISDWFESDALHAKVLLTGRVQNQVDIGSQNTPDLWIPKTSYFPRKMIVLC